jgi:hypothetical protein
MRKIAVFGDGTMSLESGEALHFAVGEKECTLKQAIFWSFWARPGQ